MADRVTMDTNVMAVTVKPSGFTCDGTPGKAAGLAPAKAPFSVEGVDSADNINPFPAGMEPYWNVNPYNTGSVEG